MPFKEAAIIFYFKFVVVRKQSFGVVWKAKHRDEEMDTVVIKKLSKESG